MPYASINDLPPAVRRAYSERCQGVFRSVFNETYGSTDGDESRSFATAHTAARNCMSSTTAAEKQSKEAVNYEVATGSARCGGCRFFDGQSSCSLVEGSIDADWVCDLYEASSSAASEAEPAIATEEGMRFWLSSRRAFARSQR